MGIEEEEMTSLLIMIQKALTDEGLYTDQNRQGAYLAE